MINKRLKTRVIVRPLIGLAQLQAKTSYTAQVDPLLPPFVKRMFQLTKLLTLIAFLAHAADPSEENYCGTTWMDAFQNCHAPCPGGKDSECEVAGLTGYSCHGYTGCAQPADEGGVSGVNGGGPNVDLGAGNNDGNVGQDDLYANNFCGTKWLTAMLSCSQPCPPGTTCPQGQTCFAATNCDKPLSPIISDMIMSLMGPSFVMGGVERQVFSESILEFLAEKLEENKVHIKGADVGDQEFSGRSLGGLRVGQVLDPWIIGNNGTAYLSLETLEESNIQVEVSISNKESEKRHRGLPTSSSALDVSMTITGDYRPPPFLDVDILIEDSINRASETVVKDLRTRGSRRGSSFFENVDGITAVSRAAATQRPTGAPTLPPTPGPTMPPTKIPTPPPTSLSPTLSPTRESQQQLQTAYGTELYEGTARSYGNLFEIRTKEDSPTVLINGLDIYSSSSGRVSYEVWTKEGPWDGFVGQVDKFELIAEGKVKSNGECDTSTAENCEFTRIPFDNFGSVPIRGGGASRSFYVTLDSKEIVYKRGISSSGDELSVQIENEDIQVFEGAGILMYPFSDVTEALIWKPRGFIGNIHYERNPCVDGSMDWPCQTRAPATVFQLSTEKPTRNPTKTPTKLLPKGPAPLSNSQPVPSQLESQDDSSHQNNLPETSLPAEGKENSASTISTEGGGNVAPSLAPVGAIESSSNLSPSAKDAEGGIDGEHTTTTESPISSSSLNEGTSSNQQLDAILEEIEEGGFIPAYIIITIDNVPDRVMNDREKNKYAEVLKNFLQSDASLEKAMVAVENIAVSHQFVMERETNGGKSNGRGKKLPANIDFRSLHGNDGEHSHDDEEHSEIAFQGNITDPTSALSGTNHSIFFNDTDPNFANDTDSSIVHSDPTAKESDVISTETASDTIENDAAYSHSIIPNDPSKVSIDVTTIIMISDISLLPPPVTNTLLLHVISEAESSLIELFHAEQAFYSYFKDITSISGRIVTEVTKVPTVSPTTFAHYLSLNATVSDTEPGEESEGINIFALVALCVGVLWCILTICSLSYLGKARSEMVNNLMLRQSKKTSHETMDEEYGEGFNMMKADLISYPEDVSSIGSGSEDESDDESEESSEDSTDEESDDGTEKCEVDRKARSHPRVSTNSQAKDFNKVHRRASNDTEGSGVSQSCVIPRKNGLALEISKGFSSSRHVAKRGSTGDSSAADQFDERIRQKLSNERRSSNGDSSAGDQFDKRMKQKMARGASTEECPSPKGAADKLDDRIRQKLSKERRSSNGDSSAGDQFDERMKQKMARGASTKEFSAPKQRRSSTGNDSAASDHFEERLRQKLESKGRRRSSVSTSSSDVSKSCVVPRSDMMANKLEKGFKSSRSIAKRGSDGDNGAQDQFNDRLRRKVKDEQLSRDKAKAKPSTNLSKNKLSENISRKGQDTNEASDRRKTNQKSTVKKSKSPKETSKKARSKYTEQELLSAII